MYHTYHTTYIAMTSMSYVGEKTPGKKGEAE